MICKYTCINKNIIKYSIISFNEQYGHSNNSKYLDTLFSFNFLLYFYILKKEEKTTCFKKYNFLILNLMFLHNRYSRNIYL